MIRNLYFHVLEGGDIFEALYRVKLFPNPIYDSAR